jgi:hypothetical protein
MNNPGVTVFLISLKAGGVALVSYTHILPRYELMIELD